MIARIRFALIDAWEALFRPRRSRESACGGEEVIKGTAGNVIIVRSPNTEYFKEAIFILCDDLFTRRGMSREALLREARRAACGYVEAHTPKRSAVPLLSHLLFFLLGAFFACALLFLLEI